MSDFRTEAMKVLSYDPESGHFTWLVDAGPVKVGDRAGGLRPDGVRMVGVLYRNVRANRLAWLFMTGSFPPRSMEVGHKNRSRDDNSWPNLRLAARIQNGKNTTVRSDSASGVRGVYRNARCGTWDASIRVDGRRIFLGQFVLISDAATARKQAERQHYGEFAPT